MILFHMPEPCGKVSRRHPLSLFIVHCSLFIVHLSFVIEETQLYQ
jgi:hypothetical protein